MLVSTFLQAPFTTRSNWVAIQDSGHKSDWENVIVEWNGDGKGGWIRESVRLGQHSNFQYLKWNDIQNTVNGYAQHHQLRQECISR